MKLSLNKKMFIIVSSIIVLIIVTVIILNSTVLESFYKSQKEKTLVDIYNEAFDYYSNNEFDSTSDFISELQRIDAIKNIEIAVCNIEGNVAFTTSNNFPRNGFFFDSPFGGPSRDFSISDLKKNLSKEHPYYINTISDKKINSDFATLYGMLSHNYYIILRTPIEAIRESVDISNKFLGIVGISCVLISSIIIYFVSKAFVKPISDLNDIALRMTNLDFSKKYNVKSNDEVGTLGNSINKLSTSLEKTIKDLKEANIDLEKDVEEKSKLSEMRNQFISDVSHELKTPIALIQGYAEGLNEGIVNDEESKKYYIEVILDEANKMSNLTKDLLDLSRLEYGKEELIIDEFSITDLAKETFRKNEVLFKEKSITPIIESSENYTVKADSRRIEQVLTNYISNAIKNAEGEKIVKCTIAPTDENKIRVSIFNTGKKIDDEEMPRLWTRFYKGDTSRNREAGGTGIGLSLVKAIMEQHNCNYGALNKEDGVEFWIELEK